MSEIVVYQDQWSQREDPGHTPLHAALQEISRNVGNNDSKYDTKDEKGRLYNRPRRLDFVTADVTDLITTGLGGLQDNLAAGFTAKNGDITWTVRWDWDESKAEHVNLTITGRRGTDKFAFLARQKGDTRSANYMVEAYHITINRFTSDCGWDKRTYDALVGEKKMAYRRLCAKKGRRALAIRVLEKEMPEVE